MSKVKSKFNFIKGNCKYEKDTWCNLQKRKRCSDCIRLKDGSKACAVKE